MPTLDQAAAITCMAIGRDERLSGMTFDCMVKLTAWPKDAHPLSRPPIPRLNPPFRRVPGVLSVRVPGICSSLAARGLCPLQTTHGCGNPHWARRCCGALLRQIAAATTTPRQPALGQRPGPQVLRRFAASRQSCFRLVPWPAAPEPDDDDEARRGDGRVPVPLSRGKNELGG